MNGFGEAAEDTVVLMSSRRVRLEELAEYFHGNYDRLRRFAFYVSGDWSSADDLVHDAFLRAWNAGAKPGRDGILTYLRRTIVSVHQSSLRRGVAERRAHHRRGRPAESVPAHDPSDRDEMMLALMQLSPQQRTCLALRYYEDRSEAEIAEMLDLSEGTVRRHVNRGTGALRKIIGGESR